MIFKPTPLQDAFVIEMELHQDDRGWFSRTFCKKEFAAHGFDGEWVQQNHSYNEKKGTLRGMHFQKAPYEEVKLVRCIVGAAFDVIIDLREDSKTYLSWFGVELSAKNRKMILIPKGFAHGFQTLKKGTELLYHHSAYYTQKAEAGIRFNDPQIGINWPLAVNVVSPRDLHFPLLGNNNFQRQIPWTIIK